MGTKPKIFVSAIVDETPKCLFSVSDSSKGRVNISIRHGDEIELGDGSKRLIGQGSHITIHPNLKSATGSTTIHGTLNMEGQQTLESHMLVEGPRSRLGVFVAGAAAGELSHKMFDFEARPRDQIVSLCTYDPRFSALNFFIMVLASDGESPDIPGFVKHTVKLSCFKIAIYHVFRLLPSIIGLVALPITRKWHTSGYFGPAVRQKGIDPMNYDHIEKLFQLLGKLSDGYRAKLMAISNGDDYLKYVSLVDSLLEAPIKASDLPLSAFQ
ncbi:hypothetical protein KCP91_08065 [Microvirga sp. SRT01]|uniref:Uncharacterized protein n=1 Tax=Sphingomonas longa TaxID=2778730 RepID=A0ABS2D5Y3_9SPHN|nr:MULTISPECIES: hypothetical protein [Alphaproteobacteria]MBM6576325.1 hypothetical protein [Sphingomonas sp. BT552]MBR7709371.1 hypothetical protein [Microvirga sp. SRT01]